MARRIVLLSDGTGNSAAKVWRTNVWRVFEALDLSGDDQVAFYDDGVGTSSFKPLAVIGGAFGYGLKRNVIDIYKFACRNIRSDDDELFAFGFSRGAFTIRVVTGLIHNQGLVQADSEGELDRLARAAYRAYRAEHFHTVLRIESAFRALRDLFIPGTYDKTANRRFANIRFLGLWDTVAAYGLPVEEMTIGVSKWIWPLELPDHNLNPDVKRACHALSLDDERTTFHPVLWNERGMAPAPLIEGKRWTYSERISQVWFAGVHSNVGGGYPDDSLAQIPLVWIMQEAKACGLTFKTWPTADPDPLIAARSGRDKDGRLYNPRSGLGGFYRYGPRSVAELCSTVFARHRRDNTIDEIFIETPKIHESVFRRIQNAARAYAPLGLPARYDVVRDDGEIVSLAQAPFESAAAAAARANAQESAWNYVWMRRLLYFATMAAVGYLLIYPLAHSLPRSDEFSSPIRWASDIIRLVGSVAPSAAAPWINGYARSPFTFIAAVLAVVALTLLSSRLGGTIGDRMKKLWRASLGGQTQGSLPTDALYWLRTRGWYITWRRRLKRSIVPFVSAVAILWLGVGFSSHVAFNLFDDAGYVCVEKDPKLLAKGDTVTVPFDIRSICANTGVLLVEGARYHVTIRMDGAWRDDKLPVDIDGFYTPDVKDWTRLAYMLGLPLRREFIRPWFRMVGRYGSTGGEEVFFDPDPESDHTSVDAQIRATRGGEFFLFVNDAVIGAPGLFDVFYRNNDGKAVATIKRL